MDNYIEYAPTDEPIIGQDRVFQMLIKQSRIYYNHTSYFYLLPIYTQEGYLPRFLLYAYFELDDGEYLSVSRLTEHINKNLERYRELIIQTYELEQLARKEETGEKGKVSIPACFHKISKNKIHRRSVGYYIWKLNPILFNVRQLSGSLLRIKLTPLGLRLKYKFLDDGLLF